MTRANPYRAAGTFVGDSYVERRADEELRREIEENQRYPYVVAARQSGKSSLLLRTMQALDPADVTSALVDLSVYRFDDYGDFWRRFLQDIARSARLGEGEIDPDLPEDTFLMWLEGTSKRLVVFVDEIDALIGASFRDQFFSKIRSLFNQRATTRRLRDLQFVLAGAAPPARLIQDQMRSPFNVGIEVELDDLSLEQISALARHLASSGVAIDGGLPARVQYFTGGSVYLCQLLLERLWRESDDKAIVGADDVDIAIDAVVNEAPRIVHFKSIYDLLVNDVRLLSDHAMLTTGRQISERSREDIRLIGVSDGTTAFRNELYRRVFGAGGALDLSKALQLALENIALRTTEITPTTSATPQSTSFSPRPTRPSQGALAVVVSLSVLLSLSSLLSSTYIKNTVAPPVPTLLSSVAPLVEPTPEPSYSSSPLPSSWASANPITSTSAPRSPPHPKAWIDAGDPYSDAFPWAPRPSPADSYCFEDSRGILHCTLSSAECEHYRDEMLPNDPSHRCRAAPIPHRLFGAEN